MGRNTKLTPDVQELIVKHLLEGLSLRRAAPLAGVTYKTAYNWLNRGREDEEGVFADFADDVDEAESHHQRGLITWIIKSADKKHGINPAPLQWLLEKRYQYEFGGKEDRTNHGAAKVTQVEFVVPEEAEAVDGDEAESPADQDAT